MHFFGAQWTQKFGENYSSTCLGCSSSFWRIWAEEWKKCSRWIQLFWVKWDVCSDECSSLLRVTAKVYEEGSSAASWTTQGFPKTCHPEDEEATARYQIPITTWSKMMVLMFHTLMNRGKKCRFMPILFGLALVQVLAFPQCERKDKTKARRRTRTSVEPQFKHNLNQISFHLCPFVAQIWLLKYRKSIKRYFKYICGVFESES